MNATITSAINTCWQRLRNPHSMTAKNILMVWGASLLIMLNILSTISIVSGSIYWWSALAFPYGMYDAEGGVLSSVLDIQNGRPLYSPLGEAPYIVNNYPPIYFVFVAAINTLTSTPPLQLGRAVSMGAAVFSAVACGAIVWCATQSVGMRRTRIIAATTASMFVLGTYHVILWSAMMRIDLLALAFSLGGMWAFVASRWRTGWLVFACIAFVLAGFTRPTMISGLLVCCGAALIIRPKIGLPMAAGCAGAAVIGIFLLDTATSGEFYKQVIWANTLYPWDMAQAISLLSQFISTYPCHVLISVAGGLAVALATFRVLPFPTLSPTAKKVPYLVTLSAAYLVVSGILALTAGKWGSDFNYLLELISAVAIMVGIVIAYSWQSFATIESKQNLRLSRYAVVSISVVISGLVILQAAAVVRDVRYYERERQRISRDGPLFSTSRDIIKMIALLPGEVLTQDRSLAVLAGKRIFFQFQDANVFMDAGAMDPAPLLNSIAGRDFPLIVVGRHTYELIQANRFTGLA